jgi:hypothetical protein
MRTQRIGLRHFLYKIKASDSDQCCCEGGSQNPWHILLQCPLYIELRKVMLDKIDMGRMVDYDKIISNPKATRYVAEFIHKAGVLGQFCEAELTAAELPEPQGA